MSNLPPSADSYVRTEPKRTFRIGETVFVRTYAGPIVRVTIKKAENGTIHGTLNREDNTKLFMAGVPECPDNYVGVFHEHCIVTKEDYDSEDWRKWSVRDVKKLKKNS